MRDEIAPIAGKHWLIFDREDTDDEQYVKGCHCGFRADLDADSGFGDSVVEHLLEVGYAAGRAS